MHVYFYIWDRISPNIVVMFAIFYGFNDTEFFLLIVNFTRHGIYRVSVSAYSFSVHTRRQPKYSAPLSTILLRAKKEVKEEERDRGISVQSTQNQLSVTFSEVLIMWLQFKIELQIFELQNRWDGNATWVFHATMCVCMYVCVCLRVSQDNIQLVCSMACHHGYCSLPLLAAVRFLS